MRTPLCLALSLAACSGEKRDSVPASTEPAATTDPASTAPRPPTGEPVSAPVPARAAPATATLKVEGLDAKTFDRDRPGELTGDGVTMAATRFADMNGSNVIALIVQSESGGSATSKRLWAYHYVETGAQVRVLREIMDREDDCEYDNAAQFVEDTLAVQDLDGDGYGEVSFVYDLGCSSDVSPNPRKLIVLENGEKWIFRGDTRVVDDGDALGGEFKPDPARARWPSGVYEQAEATWKRLLTPT